MNRILVTGGAGTVGAAVVRRLLSDPDYEVRVSDQREAPTWMREGCEVHRGDLRLLSEARKAFEGCSHVVHLAALVEPGARPHTLLEINNALHNAVFRAALDEDVTRFVYVSASAALTAPEAPYGFSKLTGEVYCRAAHDEHGLPFTICRPFDAYGPEEPLDVLRAALVGPHPLPIPGAPGDARTPIHLDDVADGIVAAMARPAGLNEDFDLAGDVVTLEALARACWEACGHDAESLDLQENGARAAVRPSAKARELLGWQPATDLAVGLAETVQWLRARQEVAA